MKFLKNPFLLFLFGLAILSSCSSDDDNATATETQIQIQIENNVENGTWRITTFIDSGEDETNHFNAYNFTFNNSGTLNATNGTNSYNGSWSITDSNSNSSDDLDFNISFSSPPDFEELSDDWDFISQSSTKIELIDVSGGNGGTDYLTFEKN